MLDPLGFALTLFFFEQPASGGSIRPGNLARCLKQARSGFKGHRSEHRPVFYYGFQ